MFTGIIEEVGKVVSIEQRGENRRIKVEAARALRKNCSRRQRCGKRRLPDRARHQSQIILRRSRARDLGANFILAHPRGRAGQPGAAHESRRPLRRPHRSRPRRRRRQDLSSSSASSTRTVGIPRTGGCISKSRRRSRNTRCSKDRSPSKASALRSPSSKGSFARSRSFLTPSR